MEADRCKGSAQLTDSSVSNEVLADLYLQMCAIRHVDEWLLRLRAAKLFVGAVHPCSGHEAIAVGAGAPSGARDVVVSYYRGIGHAVAAGADIRRLVAERLGLQEGYCYGRAGEFVICRDARLQFTAAIIGSGVAIGTGAALADQVTSTGGVTIVFFGDGALGAGIVHESMNFAATWALPVVFVCEHNGYQDHTRTEEVYPSPSLSRLAEGHQIPADLVDGNDVEAVYRAASRALHRARSGAGPSFIEARTYLRCFHLQFDEPPPPYRPPDEEAAWLARDPLTCARHALLTRGAEGAELAAIARSGQERVDVAVREVLRSAGHPAAYAALAGRPAP